MNKLEQVIAWLQKTVPQAKNIRLDSRLVEPGDVFVAVVGHYSDGRNFISKAIEKGVGAVIAESGVKEQFEVPLLEVSGLNHLVGPIASNFYANPSKKMIGIAVTGTNGKTSTTHWITHILSNSGISCATVGTIGCQYNGQSLSSQALTTPDAVTFQRILSDLALRGCHAFATEASSIGLEQGRLAGTCLKTALFTNLTRDHLDYHGSMERYKEAKEILFKWPGLECAVVNMDDPVGAEIRAISQKQGIRVIPFSRLQINPDWLCAREVQTSSTGMKFVLEWQGKSSLVETSLYGLFNIENLLGVAGVALSLNIAFEKVIDLLKTCLPPKGRMQSISDLGDPLVIVDYAHTPDAVAKAIDTLRELAEVRNGRLWIVLGAGGDRDQGKRVLMGEATSKADLAVLTSDNPRTEDPQHILDQIAEGAPQAIKILNRAEAIAHVINCADQSDVILIAGKGHEEYQEIDGVRHYFSDVNEAQKNLIIRKQGQKCQNH